jgi:hypothetical protein
VQNTPRGNFGIKIGPFWHETDLDFAANPVTSVAPTMAGVQKIVDFIEEHPKIPLYPLLFKISKCMIWYVYTFLIHNTV